MQITNTCITVTVFVCENVFAKICRGINDRKTRFIYPERFIRQFLTELVVEPKETPRLYKICLSVAISFYFIIPVKSAFIPAF